MKGFQTVYRLLNRLPAVGWFRFPPKLWLCGVSLVLSGWMVLGWIVLDGQVAWAQALDLSLDSAEMNVLGRKYSNAPPDARLQQLERQLNVAPSPKNSSQYRMNQILLAQQNRVAQSDKQAAIRLYNQGIDDVTAGNTDVAIQHYRDALQLDPGLIPASNNLANLLEKKRLYDEAAQIYQNALTLAPNEPLLHFNLAVVLEKQGNIVEAYDHYRQYVQLSPNPNPQIVELIRNFDGKRAAGRTSPDYYTLVTRESNGERLVWPPEMVPVPVFINMVDMSQTAFVQNVYQDFDTWTQVTQGRLRFREVGRLDLARIIITLKPGPLMAPDSSIGHASFNNQILNSESPMAQLKVNIVVNTGEPHSDLPLANRQEQVGKLVLHELGHAIGIWGHSQDPGDIMYTHPIVSQLSQRDINTVRKLYALR